MKFTVYERILLLNVMPTAHGDITALRIMQELTRDLGFTEAEHALLQITQSEGGNITWKDEVAPKDVEVGPVALKGLKSLFVALNQGEALQLSHLPLYERIVEGKVPEWLEEPKTVGEVPDDPVISPNGTEFARPVKETARR